MGEEDAAFLAAAQAKGVATEYAVDEIAETKTSTNPDVWMQCKILGPSEYPNQYQGEVGPDCHQDAFLYEGSVMEAPILSLRKLVHGWMILHDNNRACTDAILLYS